MRLKLFAVQVGPLRAVFAFNNRFTEAHSCLSRGAGERWHLAVMRSERKELHGMPKGDAHKRALEGLDGVNSIKVEFVSADGSVASFEQAELAQQRIPAPAPANHRGAVRRRRVGGELD